MSPPSRLRERLKPIRDPLGARSLPMPSNDRRLIAATAGRRPSISEQPCRSALRSACMKSSIALAGPAFAAMVALGACSQPEHTSAAPPTSQPEYEAATAPTATTPAVQTEAPRTTPSTVLSLDGLGDLRIGQPLPPGWNAPGGETSDVCRTATSSQYPGVVALITDGLVRRITLGQTSTVKLTEGVGVGSSEGDVQAWFAGFREEPHKYEPAPAKYLTAPNAANASSALRFEVGADGRVERVHVGIMPMLGYVEGCG